MILERCNQILLGYMCMCRLLFLSYRRDVLVRWEQIKVCDLTMRVIIPGTKDGRAAQTMRTSLGIVAENSRVCLLVNVRTLASTNREHGRAWRLPSDLVRTLRSFPNPSACPDQVNGPPHLGSDIEDSKEAVQDPHSGGGQGGGLVSGVYLSKVIENT